MMSDVPIAGQHLLPENVMIERIDYLEKTIKRLNQKNAKLISFIENIKDECSEEMSRADHKKKIAAMDSYDSEVEHQCGRWHCAYDLFEYVEKVLAQTRYE